MKADIRILIVEDEGIEALDLQRRMVSLGYDVPEIASDGEEALRMTEEMRPDLVLMDIMLPGAIDGVAVAEQIHSRFDIPVIYITAYTDENSLQRAKITEPYGYVVKPIRERELYITIDVALYKHEMERKLRLSEKLLSTTLRSIGDAVIATDMDGMITFMNPVAEELMGWRLEEIQRKKLTDVFSIINKDTRQPADNPVTRVINERGTVGLANHTLLIARDGREIPIDDNAAPIRDDKGNCFGVILVFRDITERKRAEEALCRARDELEQRVIERTAALEEQSRILESFFTHTKTGFVFLDTQFNYIRVNEAYARACQRDARDFPGNNHFDFYPSDELKGRFQHVVNFREPYYAYERAFCFPKHPDGRVGYWDLTVAPILNTKQEVECLVFTLNDVTERRRAAAELLDKDQMLIHQSRLAAMGEMIGNIAHQWRQPLNLLSLIIQQTQLFHEMGRLDEKSLSDNTAKSMKVITHMSQTIDDFRKFFMPDKEKVTFGVHEAVDKSISLVDASFNSQGIRIDVDTRQTAGIHGYQNEFSQVLLNILTNAGDVLTERAIDDPRVWITIDTQDDRVVITICDNAGGIAEDIMDKIFDPYFTTKGPQAGTGVGLYMSKTIIEKSMNGRLTVRNTAEGAEFRIEV